MSSDNNVNNGYPQMQQYVQPQMQQPMQQYYPNQQMPAPQKKKTGLIIGIIVALIAATAGVLLFVFRDKIFGSKFPNGYDSPREVIDAYFEAYADCDKAAFKSLIHPDAYGADAEVERNYKHACEIKDSVKFHLDDTTFKSEYLDPMMYIDSSLHATEAAYFECSIHITQTIDGSDYEVLDKYAGIVFKSNGKWYLSFCQETGADIM